MYTIAMPVELYFSSIVTPLLRHPDDLKVTTSQDDMGVLLSVDVHKEDMGILIGRGGETAKSIRNLVRIVGIIGKQRVSIRINEPEGTDYQRKT